MKRVRSGFVDVSNGYFRRSGLDGSQWSSRTDPSSDRYAYYFYYGISDLNPSNTYVRYYTFPLRCLARQ